MRALRASNENNSRAGLSAVGVRVDVAEGELVNVDVGVEVPTGIGVSRGVGEAVFEAVAVGNSLTVRVTVGVGALGTGVGE